MNRNLLSLAGLVIAIFSFTVGSSPAEARHCGRQRNRCCQQNGNNGWQQNSYSSYRQNRSWGNNCGQSSNCGYQQSFNSGSQQCGTNGCQQASFSTTTQYGNDNMANNGYAPNTAPPAVLNQSGISNTQPAPAPPVPVETPNQATVNSTPSAAPAKTTAPVPAT